MTTYTSFGLQDSASPLMEQLMYFHDHSVFTIITIITMVGYMILTLMLNKYIDRHVMDGQYLEIISTVMPAMVLIFIALPSLHILYLLDENSEPVLTLKMIGHHWYWSYEYCDFLDIEFDSYSIAQNELDLFSIQLLEVDNRLTLPIIMTRMLITLEDVIHSCTIPSVGVKADATPGWLNPVTFWFNRPGVFYGQYSDICGTNHSFMPIVIESTSSTDFLNWISYLYE